jgi:sugar lactone lactonase YvrE
MKKYTLSIFIAIFFISQYNYGQTINNWVLQKIDSNFLFTEGPYWYDEGHLLFSDIDGNTIYKWDPVNGSTVFLNPSGKANGISGDVYGNIYIAQQGSRRVSKIDTSGIVTTLAVLYNGDSLNSPNDIVVRTGGYIYFTDPPYGITSGQQELPFCGVFCIKEPGDSLKLLVDSLVKPNGIAFSPDEQRLYVCNSFNSKVYYYETKPDGTLKPGKLFAKVNSEIDGIETDLDGNVYVAAALKGVKIYSPLGVLIDSIAVPEKTTNLYWGDKYRNTLYITAGTSVYGFHRNPDFPFILTELLGRPTNNSVTLNMLAEEDLDAYIEYGTQTGIYSGQTTINSFNADSPIVIEIAGLNANTEYYYRVRYRKQGTSTFFNRSENSFITQRSAGSTFVFDVEADPHLDAGSNYVTYTNTLLHEQEDHPDFLVDLGDNFMSEKLPIINYNNIEKRVLLLRHFYDKICQSVPLYLVNGNHEGELGWQLDGTPDNMPVWAAQLRKLYYPNPEPNSFYTGDTSNQLYIGKRQSFYSWTWSDALFVVIDPYWYTTSGPAQSGDMWDWTLGEDQYKWLKQTLENSSAKYKFVFSHQIIGGDALGQGRGGIEYVPFFEMGGQNADSSWGFATHRPGWDKTIHQLMVENCVTIFFHGHDHFYGKQSLDSVIYQEVPQPSLMNYSNTNATTFDYTHGLIIPNSGHLRVTVSDTNVLVEYVTMWTIRVMDGTTDKSQIHIH